MTDEPRDSVAVGRRFQIAKWSAVSLGVAVTLTAVNDGLILDDHVHALFAAMHRALGTHRFWELFDVWGRRGATDISAHIALGALPWWTLPNLSMAFFRPLAALTHYMDYTLWPEHPAWMHLENCLLYAVLVWLVSNFYRRIDGRTPQAALAVLAFAASDAHALSVAWISGRNTLMTAVAIVGVLLAHDRYCRDGWRPGRWVAPIILLAGYASSEGALAAWAYLVPHAVFVDQAPTRQRWLRLAALAAVSIAWQLFYRAAGYGVYGSGVYRDPFTSPVIFFTEHVPRTLPAGLRELLAPSRLGALVSNATLKAALPWISGSLAAVCVVLALRVAVRDRKVAYWLSALLLSLFPLCTAVPTPRFFLVPGIAVFALVARLSLDLWRVVFARGHRLTRTLAAALAFVLAIVHGVRALCLAPGAHEELVQAELSIRRSATRLPSNARSAFDMVYVLNTPHVFITAFAPVYAPAIWPPRTYILGSSTERVHVTRPDATSIVLESPNGYLNDLESQFVRAPEHGFSRGQVVAMGPMRVTVEDITPDGRPRRVRFRSEALEQPRALWVTWVDGGYQQVRLPAIGASSDLPE